MAQETWVQSQVESYQRLLKWYLMPPCLTLSIIRIKLRNPGKGVAPFPTPWCSSYRKGSLWVTLDYGRQLMRSGLLVEIRWSLRISKLQWSLCLSFSRTYLAMHISFICRVKFKLLAWFQRITLPTQRVNYTLSVPICCIILWCDWSFSL